MHAGFQPALGRPSQSHHTHANIYMCVCKCVCVCVCVCVSVTNSAAGKSVARVIATESNNFFTLGAENLF